MEVIRHQGMHRWRGAANERLGERIGELESQVVGGELPRRLTHPLGIDERAVHVKKNRLNGLHGSPLNVSLARR